MQKHEYCEILVVDCLLLERNPQYLTPKQMDALKKSIERDGFVAPILVRPHPSHRGKYEVISGNHRFMAAKSLGYERIPAVVADLAEKDAKRLALNLNFIHGDPTAEQIAPFLGEMPDDVLCDIHLPDDLASEVMDFDDVLADRLTALEAPSKMDTNSVTSPIRQCVCPACGKSHIAKEKK